MSLRYYYQRFIINSLYQTINYVSNKKDMDIRFPTPTNPHKTFVNNLIGMIVSSKKCVNCT